MPLSYIEGVSPVATMYAVLPYAAPMAGFKNLRESSYCAMRRKTTKKEM